VSEHEFHRTEVKRGLTAYLHDLVAEFQGFEEAEKFIKFHPYNKEQFYNLVFDMLDDKYNYPESQKHLLNTAIIGRIQFENL
jgi:hypothetical protein